MDLITSEGKLARASEEKNADLFWALRGGGVRTRSYTGKVENGERLLAPIKAFGKLVGDIIQRRSYVSQQSLLNATQLKGRRCYWNSEYLPRLSPELLGSGLENAQGIMSPHSAVILFQLGGAVAKHSLAFSLLDVRYSMLQSVRGIEMRKIAFHIIVLETLSLEAILLLIAGCSNPAIPQPQIDVYAGGYSQDSSMVSVPGYWKNGIWIGLTPLDATGDSTVRSLVVSGSDVYAGGHSENNFGIHVPGYWKNGVWTTLTPLDSTKDSDVYSLVISGSDVYAGGHSTISYSIWVPGYWKNDTWTAITPLDSTKRSGIYCLVVSGRDIYAGGYGTLSNNLGNVRAPGYWKNGKWIDLTPLDSTKSSSVQSLVIVE